MIDNAHAHRDLRAERKNFKSQVAKLLGLRQINEPNGPVIISYYGEGVKLIVDLRYLRLNFEPQRLPRMVGLELRGAFSRRPTLIGSRISVLRALTVALSD